MGMQVFVSLWLCVICGFLDATSASVISFTSSTDVIKDGLTDAVTLQCSLSDTTRTSGRRDVSQTAQNVAQVTSIVVMRSGQDIASVSHAHVTGNNKNIQVSGSVAGTSGTDAFIKLTFWNPLRSGMGEFTCKINAVTQSSQAVTFSSSLEITSETPTITDLVQSIRSMNSNAGLLQQSLTDLTKETDAHTAGSEIFFSAGLSSDLKVVDGGVVVFDEVYANVGSGYDQTTGMFTSPVSGYFHFQMSAMAPLGSYAFRLRLFVNDKKDFSIYATHSYNGASNSAILKLSRGDVVKVVSELSSSSYLGNYNGGMNNSFNGRLVART